MKPAWSLVSVCSLGHTLLVPLFLCRFCPYVIWIALSIPVSYHLVCGWILFPFHSCVIFHSMAKALSFLFF